MSSSENEPKLVNGILSLAPVPYVNALLTLHDKLDDKNVDWVVGGDLGEVLRTVNTSPDSVEILVSKGGADVVALAVAEFNPSKVKLETQQLPRNATVEGKEYPAYIRSYYSEFNISEVNVKVHVDLQYRINSWEWGDKLEFKPEYVSVVGKTTAVVPLSIKYELYQLLGWTDKVEQIKEALERQRPHRPPSRFRM
jgi:hypothetical protein